ncbi:hypothetical protein B0H17DRAFT_1145332 [Mycena rosella]|uniref:Uncharacterized protein n=1 Tax=Mycena rosella TaxID=1033263 RepID=A0AAD7CRE3_MYCRO|nr:hypothetical protein B0H17DRAFT_1145332 [Mycena rosella]
MSMGQVSAAAADIPVESRINFQKHIDPAGTLSQHIRDCVVHCVENDVAYLCVKKARYMTKEPSGFRVGDIVEMGFELVAFRQAIRGEEDKHICRISCSSGCTACQYVHHEVAKRE